jgi:hypothetical protein
VEGAAYVFTRSDGVWSQQAEFARSAIRPRISQENDYIGGSVAISEDIMVLGSFLSDSNNYDGGEPDDWDYIVGAVYLNTGAVFTWQ